jgi:2-(1,2-epoxy-1,2-dihydrophenyl)acetyl-CoA isomerase
MSAKLAVTVVRSIATLMLDRPAVGNTIDMALARALIDAAVRCDEDQAIRCIVLTGRGRLFCGGGDVSAFAEAGDDISAFLRELASALHEAISRLMRMKKPLVVLVNGPAAGAGLSLALAGDITLATKSAHFTAAYGALGLTPDGGMTWSLPRLVGRRRAQEIILSNRRVSAEEAAAIGLVTRVVADDALEAKGPNSPPISPEHRRPRSVRRDNCCSTVLARSSKTTRTRGASHRRRGGDSGGTGGDRRIPFQTPQKVKRPR